MEDLNKLIDDIELAIEDIDGTLVGDWTEDDVEDLQHLRTIAGKLARCVADALDNIDRRNACKADRLKERGQQ